MRTSYLQRAGLRRIQAQIPHGDGAVLSGGADDRVGSAVYFGCREIPVVCPDPLDGPLAQSQRVKETEGLVRRRGRKAGRDRQNI